jgi:hypothetical protein
LLTATTWVYAQHTRRGPFLLMIVTIIMIMIIIILIIIIIIIMIMIVIIIIMIITHNDPLSLKGETGKGRSGMTRRRGVRGPHLKIGIIAQRPRPQLLQAPLLRFLHPLALKCIGIENLVGLLVFLLLKASIANFNVSSTRTYTPPQPARTLGNVRETMTGHWV